MHGGHYNQEKSIIFGQFASIAGGCVGSFTLAQKCRPINSEFTFLLEQQIKFVLISKFAHVCCKKCLPGQHWQLFGT